MDQKSNPNGPVVFLPKSSKGALRNGYSTNARLTQKMTSSTKLACISGLHSRLTELQLHTTVREPCLEALACLRREMVAGGLLLFLVRRRWSGTWCGYASTRASPSQIVVKCCPACVIHSHITLCVHQTPQKSNRFPQPKTGY